MSCLSVLENHFSHFIITEQGHGVFTPFHPLWHIAGSCCVSGFLACLLQLCPILNGLISCFSSMGEHCYVFHINLNFQM